VTEGEELSEMTDADAEPTKMSEVLRLANALAEQMLGSQIMGRSIPTSHLTALVIAARYLTDNNITWPPLVQEVVHEMAERMESARPVTNS
jgi:hypothetical protein